MKKSFTWIFFSEKFDALEKALKLQAKEYERRLEDLNGEAGRLKQMKAELTPREVFENRAKEVNEKLDMLTAWKGKQDGKSQLLQYIPWLLTVISLILLYNKR